MQICHKIGEPDEVVVWTTCLKCTLDGCVIWRLTRPYVIDQPKIPKLGNQTEGKE